MKAVWNWFRHVMGLDVFDRVTALEKRMAHNEGAIEGAINAFKDFAEGRMHD